MIKEALDISIVVPCYNGQQYLSAVLASIYHQRTALLYKVIIIDWGPLTELLKLLLITQCGCIKSRKATLVTAKRETSVPALRGAVISSF